MQRYNMSRKRADTVRSEEEAIVEMCRKEHKRLMELFDSKEGLLKFLKNYQQSLKNVVIVFRDIKTHLLHVNFLKHFNISHITIRHYAYS